jgi:hypothetical protein
MKSLVQYAMLAALVLASGASCAYDAPATSEQPSKPKLSCTSGPLKKTYGGSEWLLYACDDSRSLLVITQQENPAAPFLFVFYVTPEGGMRLDGEGTGDRHASDLAYAELKLLSTSDVSALVGQAQDAGRSGH